MPITSAQTSPPTLIETLKLLGASKRDQSLPETKALPLLIKKNEIVEGIIYGKYTLTEFSGSFRDRGALVFTDRRVLLIDRKPLFFECKEFSYDSVSGITYSKAASSWNVIVQTKSGEISIHSSNQKLVHSFVEAFENRLIIRPKEV